MDDISSAALDAPYGQKPVRCMVGSIVVTLMMRPQPCATMAGATRTAIISVAMQLVS